MSGNTLAAKLETVWHQHLHPLASMKGYIVSMQISDVHKIKKLLEDARTYNYFKEGFPIIKPFLKILGVDTESIEDTFPNIEGLSTKIKEMSTVPDRFNDSFAEKGWILFERMNLEVAQEALAIAEQGDFDSAEKILVDYFNPQYVELELRTMNAVEAFRPRMDLAKKAQIDYREGRYHACIPVILAQIDGLVSELHELQRGFFTEDTNLEAWDSLAAHSKGLNQLSLIFRKGRRKTTTESIRIPYRHGIIHGRNLGYANKIVAAKTWAALFAVREWAIKAERNELYPPPEEPEMSFMESITSIIDSTQEKKRWEEWVRREVDLSKFGVSPIPEILENGSPEKRLAEYLQLWMKSNYGFMAKFIPHLFLKYAETPLPAQIRSLYSSHHLLNYAITNIDHSVAGMADIQIELELDDDRNSYQKDFAFRMVCENTDGEMVAKGNPSGRWVVMNWNSIQYPQ